SARRRRLEAAGMPSLAARAALRNASERTLLLAGSQLGITLCALALGSITKPAVHHWLTPVFSGWGLPLWSADVIAFILALVLVTFLHLVDRKSTRLNSSHVSISYAVFCLKKKHSFYKIIMSD